MKYLGQVLAARLRVGVGRRMLYLGIALAAICYVSALSASPRYVFCANANDYSTMGLAFNPTDAPLVVTPPSKIGPAPSYTIAPHSAGMFPCESTFGVESVDAGDGLLIFSRYETPTLTNARHPELQPVTFAEFLGLESGLGLESHVIVGTVKGVQGWVTVTDGSIRHVILIGPGESHLIAVYSPRVTIKAGYDSVAPALPGPSSFFAFAMIVHDATGAFQTVEPAAVKP